jgi:hypothetical protein
MSDFGPLKDYIGLVEWGIEVRVVPYKKNGVICIYMIVSIN